MEDHAHDPVETDFRLLTIFNDSAETISCVLENAELGSNVSYKALPYCWGDKAVTRTILVNNAPYEVPTKSGSSTAAVSI